ncbi:MAG TPA: Tat pathway signal protein [Terriglobales bacterium]|nr:Tat pathway signal protein [Terriglobales bacterium]
MDRRRFLQNAAVTTAALHYFPSFAAGTEREEIAFDPGKTLVIGLSEGTPDIDGHTLICEFKIDSTDWKVYEDLRTRDGAMTFISGKGSRVLTKSAEAAFADAGTPYLGLNLKDIGMSGPDLLADRILQGGGDPDPELVRSAAPPQGSKRSEGPSWRLPWDAFVGTKECSDTMPVYPSGSTRTYHPVGFFPEQNRKESRENREKLQRFEGLVGGWMPAVRKVLVEPGGNAHDEIIVFGDVGAHDKFIVQTWHRTARIENGKIVKVIYGYSYPAFPPRREDPPPEEFYRAVLIFAGYWDNLLRDFAPTSLPQNVWIDMSKHAFAKELMVRPGGVYPKYGAVDRDYYGSEYDGFQDIFTSAVYSNLEWGRFEQARDIIDNYFSDFVDSKGVNNMRGPETAQFGLTLSLLARYFNYTRDSELLLKHREKVEATASLLSELHDESLRLPQDDLGHGLIHGWSESDSCLMPQPNIWWLPYFSHNAFAARGLRDFSRVWPDINQHNRREVALKQAADWTTRSKTLQDALIAGIEKDIRHDVTPPYIGFFPGTKLMFRESMQKEKPSPQQWAHRAYCELLQPDVLSEELANLVIDCMRAYGAMTLGVVANVEPPHPDGRDMLGFISYGYAQMLLRLDRIEEYLLFLYSHRYHDHTRGSWVAGEVSGIDGDTATFCIPAQHTIPLLVRWMLVLEDSDEDILYLAKGVPRDWVDSGKEIRIDQAPTRWGRVSLKMKANSPAKTVTANVELAQSGSPKQIHVKLRLPVQNVLRDTTVNGNRASLGGRHNDTVIINTGNEKQFEIVGKWG